MPKTSYLAPILLLLCACQTSKLDKKSLFAQITSREYIISQIEVLGEGKILIDTLKKAYNAKKQLVVENENIFFLYDNTGRLTEKIVCLDENCENTMAWKYEYQKDKIFVRQFRNEDLQQMQETDNFKKQNTSKAADSAHIFLEQESLWQDNILIKGQYIFFENETKNHTVLEQKYQYDSLGKLIQVIRIPDKDSTNCIKIAFQYENGKVSKSLHSRFMPLEGDIKHYVDHYKTYTYNSSGQLVEVQTFSQREAQNKLFSITKYSYILK